MAVFRPHARLLTMLGEQLITSDRVALVELVKNSYDADARKVTIDFRGFESGLVATESSMIVIEDDGMGMTEEVILKSWLNPATPSKRDRKRRNPKTDGGRMLQGEKGIGRFAAFKLGSQISLSTRAKDSERETTVVVDVSSIDEGGEESPMFLDQFPVDVESGPPMRFKGDAHGTRIEIASLRSEWSEDAARRASSDLHRLQPLMWESNSKVESTDTFAVEFLLDGQSYDLSDPGPTLQSVAPRAVLRVTEGHFDAKLGSFKFNLNDRPQVIEPSDLRAISFYRRRFQQLDQSWRAATCGSFQFAFYIFDLDTGVTPGQRLDPQEKDLVRSHRVYLYRDGVRVYPYGDPDDDWLSVDATRGTKSARSMFSNDQLIGYVEITQAENPDLRDKTSREGLIESGTSTGDFLVLVQSLLSRLRGADYQVYILAKRRAREEAARQAGGLDSRLDELQGSSDLPPGVRKKVEALAHAVKADREVARMQLETTQELAGVGMSIETAAHDLIASASEAYRLSLHVQQQLVDLGLRTDPVHDTATSLAQRLDFVVSRFRDVEGLFASTREVARPISVMQIVRRVRSMYRSLHSRVGISFELDESRDFRAITTEGALLITLINLIDNATYWLEQVEQSERIVRAYIPEAGQLCISDNGPGISEHDAPFIFEPFYSAKGERGKGLGLFLSRELGLRNGFRLDFDSKTRENPLGGAQFMIHFEKVDGDGAA